MGYIDYENRKACHQCRLFFLIKTKRRIHLVRLLPGRHPDVFDLGGFVEEFVTLTLLRAEPVTGQAVLN
jgi:hypothetical protein